MGPTAPWCQYAESGMLAERTLEVPFYEQINDEMDLVCEQAGDETTPISLVRGKLGDQRVKGTLYQGKSEEALKGFFVSTTVRLPEVTMSFSSPVECRMKPQLSV